jgi:hypothetical protein
VRDAEPAEFPDSRYPRVEPREPLIRVRSDGTWRAGRIVKWVHELSRGRWLIWAAWDAGGMSSARGWLVHDPDTIRQRRDGQAPS